jgi:hypothetical protein
MGSPKARLKAAMCQRPAPAAAVGTDSSTIALCAATARKASGRASAMRSAA